MSAWSLPSRLDSLARPMALAALLVGLTCGAARASSPGAGVTSQGQTVRAEATAQVNFTRLAQQEAALRAQGLFTPPPVRVKPMDAEDEERNEMGFEPGAGMIGAPSYLSERPPVQLNIASPSPSQT